jgi:hypothetical protein
MAVAYRDRRLAEREWEIAKLRFLARAFGAEIKDEARPSAPAPTSPTSGRKLGTIERLAQGRRPLASVTYVD